MTRLLALAAIGGLALYYLDSSGTVQISSGGGGSGGAVGGYLNSSSSAIKGIKGGG